MVLGPGAALGFSQQVAPSDAKTETKAASPAVSAPAASAPAAALPPMGQKPAEKPPVPGLDPKTGVPFYEEIQEDWSSLQVGTSKLVSQEPMVGGVDEEDTFTRVMARVQWRPGDPIDLWIMLPKGVKKPPVVIYLYGAGQDTARFRDNRWAERVTNGGVAAVGFVSALSGPRFHDRPMKQWFVSELQESLGSSVHDVTLILDYMAKSGQFDMDRVGMFGEGSGGTIAILAAAADPRIKAVDTLEPWGDWPDFLATSPVVGPDPNHADFVKPEFLKKVANLDPVKWLPELKTPVRIQQVRESEAVPMVCKDALQAAASKQTEVVRFAAVSDLGKRESGGRLFEWIKDKLLGPGNPGVGPKISVAEKAGDRPPASAAKPEAHP
jgi:dienelactone hydrolase